MKATIRLKCRTPVQYVVTADRADAEDGVSAYVEARVSIEGTWYWHCHRHPHAALCDDIRAVEGYRISAGLPRSPAERDPDDR